MQIAMKKEKKGKIANEFSKSDEGEMPHEIV